MTPQETDSILSDGLPQVIEPGRRVLLIVPDTTRTAPVGDLVQRMVPMIQDLGARVDIIVALGTHPALPGDVMKRHLGVTDEALAGRFADVKLMNHEWNNPASLGKIGEIPAGRVAELTGGPMAEDVDLTLNRVISEYDQLLILGPVFPHEIAGFSGGSKYLFPGISGVEMINFSHWLGAVITNRKIIGVIDNPVRRVLDEAAGRVPMPVDAVSIVVHHGDLAHLSVGPVFESWRAAAEQSARLHVVRKPRLFHRALSCAPLMYPDLWTGGKCMFKVEPVIEDGGEIIIYAPHADSFSVVHGRIMNQIGYHVRDYFLKQMDRFRHVPRAVMAVSTYLKGSGTFEDGVETPRIKVSVASQIPREDVERAGLGYVDMNEIDIEDWRGREDEGILFVERAGETLYLPEEGV